MGMIKRDELKMLAERKIKFWNECIQDIQEKQRSESGKAADHLIIERLSLIGMIDGVRSLMSEISATRVK